MPADLLSAGHVPGHEFTGVIAALGPGVGGWSAGESPQPRQVACTDQRLGATFTSGNAIQGHLMEGPALTLAALPISPCAIPGQSDRSPSAGPGPGKRRPGNQHLQAVLVEAADGEGLLGLDLLPEPFWRATGLPRRRPECRSR
jgi:hypothetical protein